MDRKQRKAPELSTRTFGRRTLMRNTAALVGGTAAAGLLSPSADAAQSGATKQTQTAASGPIIVATASKAIVETTAGKVRGYTRNGIYTFKGMPYGLVTPANRFMAPMHPVPWPGVRNSMAFGPVCPQSLTSAPEGRRAGWGRDEEAFMFEWSDGHPGEDCLRINVWTPSINDNRKRPVMVWIHGGIFEFGSDEELPAYDGENLARRGDVVMVSLNHRLGALGFLNLMEYGDKWADSANAGMLDLVAALQWVRDNISNFGGDTGRVMIFGQSGGGAKVSTLMAMPRAKGLFHRASVQSGSTLRLQTPDQTGVLTAGLLEQLGITGANLDKLQRMPVDDLVRAGVLAGLKRAQTAPAPGRGTMRRWGPTVDGNAIPRHPFDPDGPAVSAEVPLMVGTVLNEFANSVQAGDATLDDLPMAEIRKRLAVQHGDKTDGILDTFRKAHPKATPYELFSIISGTGARINAITQAERKAAMGAAPAYNWWFHWQTPVLDGKARAFHTAELAFCFSNTDRCTGLTGGGPRPRALAAKVADAWINFARNGDPNHAGLPRWPKFTAPECPTMIFNDKCVMRNNPDKAERESLRS